MSKLLYPIRKRRDELIKEILAQREADELPQEFDFDDLEELIEAAAKGDTARFHTAYCIEDADEDTDPWPSPEFQEFYKICEILKAEEAAQYKAAMKPEVFDCPGCDGKGTILSSQTKRGGFYSMCKVCDGTGKKP